MDPGQTPGALALRRRGLLAAVALTLLAAAPAAAAPAVRWPTVTLVGGGSWGPAQTAGQTVVVVFFHTTCPFCQRHNPHIQRLHEAARAQGRALAVLGVARDGPQGAEPVRHYVAEAGLTFPVTLDQAALDAALAPRKVIPYSVVVSPQGQVLQAVPGEMFEEDVMEWLALAPATKP